VLITSAEAGPAPHLYEETSHAVPSAHLLAGTSALAGQDITPKVYQRACGAPQFVRSSHLNQQPKEDAMPESVYKVIELVGTSPNSWEDAARNAVETASKSLRDLRVAEVGKLDLKVEGGRVVAYRARVQLSFKYVNE
jgi:flavin-binding protein dodecin